jgi:large subunit ribosomal protein L24
MASSKNVKLHIRTGDSVVVISGEDKGKSGKVLSVDKESKKAIVEGINIVTKHNKPTANVPNGGIVKKEAPLYISKLMIADPKTGKATRIGRKLDASGKMVRYSKKSGEVIKNG